MIVITIGYVIFLRFFRVLQNPFKYLNVTRWKFRKDPRYTGCPTPNLFERDFILNIYLSFPLWFNRNKRLIYCYMYILVLIFCFLTYFGFSKVSKTFLPTKVPTLSFFYFLAGPRKTSRTFAIFVDSHTVSPCPCLPSSRVTGLVFLKSFFLLFNLFDHNLILGFIFYSSAFKNDYV